MLKMSVPEKRLPAIPSEPVASSSTDMVGQSPAELYSRSRLRPVLSTQRSVTQTPTESPFSSVPSSASTSPTTWRRLPSDRIYGASASTSRDEELPGNSESRSRASSSTNTSASSSYVSSSPAPGTRALLPQTARGPSSSPTRLLSESRGQEKQVDAEMIRTDKAKGDWQSSATPPATASKHSSALSFNNSLAALGDETEFHSFQNGLSNFDISASSGPDGRQGALDAGEEEFQSVVALHDFISDTDTCLSFRAGQIIKVYNRDESGWWDGELGGQRGWFPSNYVDFGRQPASLQGAVTADEDAARNIGAVQEGVMQQEEAPIVEARKGSEDQVVGETSNNTTLRNERSDTSRFSGSTTPTADGVGQDEALPAASLKEGPSRAGSPDPLFESLEPIRQAISLLRNAVKARRISHFQPSTACVISSVRSVLSSTDCLTRESTILKAHPVLARERKQILAELSKLVTQARSSSAKTRAETSEDTRRAEMDLMLIFADHVLNNVRRFLEVAQECGIALPDRAAEDDDGRNSDAVAPYAYPASTFARQLPNRGDQDKTPTPDSPRDSTSNLVRNPSRDGPSAGGSSVSNLILHTNRMRQSGRMSQASGTQSDYTSTDHTEGVQDEPVRARAGSPDSASSYRRSSVYSPVEVLEQMNNANDHLLSIIAAFIGHIHSHSRDSHASSYAFLIDTTRATVDGVRNLLVIVEAVHSTKELQETQEGQMAILWETRESVYEATAALVTAARIATASQSPHGSEDDENNRGKQLSGTVMADGINDDVDEKSKLLQCATAVLRTGGECFSAVKTCLQKADASLRIQLAYGPKSSAVTSQTNPESESADANGDDDKWQQSTSRRGNHTLSYLGRKATSLSCLRERYEPSDGKFTSLGSYVSPFAEINEDADNMDDKLGASPVRRLSQRSVDGQDVITSADGSDSSENMSRQHSRASASTVHSSRTDLTTDTSNRPSMDQSGASSSVLSADDGIPHTAPLTGGFPRDKLVGQKTHPRHRSTSLSRSDDSSPFQRWPAPHSGQRSASDPAAARQNEDHLEGLYEALSFDQDHDPSDVCYNSEGQLTGATLNVLVEKMTPHNTTIDATISNAFFMCFRLFASPMDVFNALQARYEMPPPAEIETDAEAHARWMENKVAPVRLRIFNFFKLWLENHWNAACDFEMLEPLIEFTKTSMTHSLHRPGQRLAELAQRRLDAGKEAHTAIFAITMATGGNIVRGPGSLKRVVSSDRAPSVTGLTELSGMYLPASFPAKGSMVPPAPIVSKSLMAQLRSSDFRKVNVLDFDPQELARQLTIKESRIYCSILPEELLGQEFSKKSGISSAVHVKSMSSLSTHITGWVSESILGEEDIRKRTQIVKYFIKVGERCLGLNNFNTLFAIQGALNSSTISRLKKTWDGLPAKYRTLMEHQRAAVEHTRNFASYRQRLRATMAPALPFVGLFLTDLTFCHEGNAPTRVSPVDSGKQLLNFDKYVKMSRIIGDLQRFQQPFCLLEVPELQKYLHATLEEMQQRNGLQTADELYRRSLHLEPRSAGSGGDGGALETIPPLPTRSGVGLDLFGWKGLQNVNREQRNGLDGKMASLIR